jgi:DNA-binding transcriptional ArsR family regulator
LHSIHISITLETLHFYFSRNMEQAEVVRSLAALAQPLRLQVLRALVVAGLTPGRMQEALGIPAATLSFHLKELAQAGLVTQERSSRNLIYRAAYVRMNALLAYLTENCCQGEACAVPEAAASCPC